MQPRWLLGGLGVLKLLEEVGGEGLPAQKGDRVVCNTKSH